MLNERMRQGLLDTAARQAIANNLATHSRGVDRANLTVLSGAYHPDATVDYGFFSGPARDFAQILIGAQKAQPVTHHRTSNMWIKVEGSKARSESYVVAYLESPDPAGAIQRWIGGRYLDRLEQRDGQWRLAHRAYVMDWNINRPGTAAWADPGDDYTNFSPRGGHGAADPGNALLGASVAGFRQANGGYMAGNIDEQLIDEVISRQALHDLNMAYARAADRGDAALMASLFHEDSTVVSGVFNGSGPDFAQFIIPFITSNLQRCFHSVANEWYQVRGDDAVGESYVIAWVTAGGQDVLSAGRYIDAFQRRNGTWKFKSRAFVTDYTASHPTTHADDGMYDALTTRGCFGREDPVYKFWS